MATDLKLIIILRSGLYFIKALKTWLGVLCIGYCDHGLLSVDGDYY